MGDLIPAMTLAAIVSLLFSLAGAAISSFADEHFSDPHDRVLIWRTVRVLAILPFMVAVLALNFSDRLIENDTAGSEQAVSLAALDPLIEIVRSTTAGQPVAVETGEPRSEAGTAASEPMNIPWAKLGTLIYLAGALFALGRFAIRRLALSVLMANSQSADGELQDLFERWRCSLQLSRRRIGLRVVDAPISPFVIGLLPRVFLPKRLAQQSARKTAELALVHELIHVRRGDEWDRIIGEIFSVVFWFNPMLGWVERRLAHVREMACDAETLDVLGKERRRAYAGALVEAARAEPLVNSKVMAFGTHHKRSKVMRIKAILSGHQENRQALLVKIGVVAGFTALVAPACAAQAIATASVANPAGSVPVTTLASAAIVQSSEVNTLRSVIESSPLESLKRLEELESIGDISEESILQNPANWAAIGAYASGVSTSLNISGEDNNGNPIRISLREDDEGDFVSIDFVDEDGRQANLNVQSPAGGSEEITLQYEGEDLPHLSVSNGDDEEVLLRFRDDENRPIRFSVSEEDNDTALIDIMDEESGEQSRLRFEDHDDDIVRAPADGRVTHVGIDTSEDEYGRYAVIDHGTGWSTIFYRMEDVTVARGQSVAFNDVIGQSTEDGVEWDDDGSTNMAIVRTANVRF
ncbi:M56 family metallopeptidase [Hyphobacterium sp. HN65]|uniref:M56 family metallopeptidase n=1 Tax=Hyphobacterium lacteum TaxID=3116575 RepID=A0ABU7LRX7_9PROT|nr:M56 family metallopeptidase [Hyphobacterium sp. HN65]MEE2526396.1 M56 family metallopeptidase [Hyphobacterium sp. HN65]